MEFIKEPTIKELKNALMDCYMLASRQRAVSHSYAKEDFDGNVVVAKHGPKSKDETWDHIIRFCEQAGLRMSIIKCDHKAGGEK